MPLMLGVHTGQQDVELDELRSLWRYIDEHGWDFISIWDHFYEAPPIDGTHPAFEAISAMTLLAAETEQVRIGCHVFCMNYRNPALLAKSLMTIDHASHGRVEVGLGAGWHVQEHEGFGYNFPSVKERLDRLEEGIQIIKGMFTQEKTTFSGQYYSANDAMLYPRPVQDPVPIVVGGRGEKRTLKIAAQYANGWNVPYINVEEFERLNGVLDEWCEKVDRDPAELERSVNLHMLMGTDDADAARIRDLRAGTHRGGGTLSGNPQEAIETLKRYEEAGADRVSIAIRPPIEWESLQSFVEEVMPAVQG
jgi:F420-dependent oxidoreductase-like protein